MSIAVGSNTNQKPWRPRDSDDETIGGILKKGKYSSWYVTLERESPEKTDEDDESVHTIQGQETEFAHDTSDTSTHTCISSSEGDNLSVHVEYELDSLSEDEDRASWNSSSSEPEDEVTIEIIRSSDYDLGEFADDSEDTASLSSISEGEIKIARYSKCVECQNTNNNPAYRYCEKCYQVRRSHFSRTRRKKKQKTDTNTQESSSRGTLCGSSSQELSSMDSGIASSQEFSALLRNESIISSELKTHTSDTETEGLPQTSSTSTQLNGNSPKISNVNMQNSNNLCPLCETNEKNGIFVHGKKAHISCCYKCAKKAWIVGGKRCIICKRKANQVLQGFLV